MDSTMGSKPTLTIFENYSAAPSHASAIEFSLPLTLFDMRFLNFFAMQRVFFYEYEHPNAYFIETTVPELKESLALTLKHYLPLAGSLIYPLNSGKPKFRYAFGDSVPMVIAESSDDFKYLTANHARDAVRFCPLVPLLPPATDEVNSKVFRLLSVQVTLFPSTGISIGITFPHVIVDASSIIGFIRTWASINKQGTDAHLVAAGEHCLPLFDRSVIKDPHGLADKIWSFMKGHFQRLLDPIQPPIKDCVRATFVLGQAEIEKLKNRVLSRQPKILHASTFVVTNAYIWICTVKAGAAIGEEVKDEEEERFAFAVDCRPRFDPPIPANYFGNCIVSSVVTSKCSQLIGEEGIFTAAFVIGEAIEKRLKNMDGVLKGDFIRPFQHLDLKRILAVAGSPKFDAYDADFGWGKPEKSELITIEAIISHSKCRKSEGSFEFGLCLPKIKMDAFTRIFNEGLKNIIS